MRKYIERKGFVFHHNDWFCKGFVYLRIIKGQIEVKTVDLNNKSTFFDLSTKSIDEITLYYKALLN